jgi:hypothetical protein
MRRLHVTDRRQRGREAPDSRPSNFRDRMLAGIGVRDEVPDPRAQGKATRSPDETATRRHLEGAEQGPA